MKKIVSIIILILALTGIIGVTVYTLNHKGVREEVEPKVHKEIEKVTSKLTNENLTEIYNVYLNKERHKLKIEYGFINEEENSKIELFVYLDGKTILNEQVMISDKTNFTNLVEEELFDTIIKLKEKNLKIMEFENKEYLLIDVFYNLEYNQEKYFLFNVKGESYFEEGILVFDEKVNYQLDNDEVLDIFYDTEHQVLAKVDKNEIYVLELKKGKKKNQLLEYKYFIKENKLEKELLNTYDNIIVENIKKK